MSERITIGDKVWWTYKRYLRHSYTSTDESANGMAIAVDYDAKIVIAVQPMEHPVFWKLQILENGELAQVED
jgi:hypothetical protein